MTEHEIFNLLVSMLNSGKLGTGKHRTIENLINDIRSGIDLKQSLIDAEDEIDDFASAIRLYINDLVISLSNARGEDQRNIQFFINSLRNKQYNIDWQLAKKLIEKYKAIAETSQEAELSQAQLTYAFNEIPFERLLDLPNDNKSKSFLVSFFPGVKAQLIAGRPLSPRQTKSAIGIVKEFAPKRVLMDLGLYVEPQVEQPDTPGQPKPVREKTPDEIVKDIITKIKPYFAGDKAYFTGFAASVSQYRGSLSEKQFNVCKKYISNYQDQFDANTIGELNRVDAIGEQDEFYRDYSLDYIMFLVAVCKYATARSEVRVDKDIDEFVRTNGLGPETEVGYNWKTGTRGTIPAKTEKWEKHVVHVHEKLKKACEKGHLQEISDYIEDPSEFARDPRKALAIVSGSEYTDASVFTQKQRDAAHRCMQLLAAACDYAHAEDFQGFNKTDTIVGHYFASLPCLTDEQMPRAVFMCRFYRKQLPRDLVKAVIEDEIVEDEDEDTGSSIVIKRTKTQRENRTQAIRSCYAQYLRSVL